MNRTLVNLLPIALMSVMPMTFADPPLAGATDPPAAGLTFIENLGQWPDDIRFLGRRGPLTTCLTADATWMRIDNGKAALTLRQTLVGARAAQPTGRRATGTRHHFFVGSDRRRWRTDARAFAEVWVYEAVPGVDLRYYERSGRLEYDLILADVDALDGVELRIDGIDELAITPAGDLSLRSAVGDVHLTAPIAWIEAGAERLPVACRYRLTGTRSYGFEVTAPRGRRLVIDPGLEASTFLGGIATDGCEATARGPDGTIYLTGRTGGYDFPLTPGIITGQSPFDYSVAFVVAMTADLGALRWSTLIGGILGDTASLDLIRDRDGHLFLTGNTAAGDFPTTPGAYSRAYSGDGIAGLGDAFVSRLSAAGLLTHSTLIGGAGDEVGQSICFDAHSRQVVIGGTTYSATFPVTPDAQQAVQGGSGTFARDGFVARFDASLGQLLYATYLGGSAADAISDLAVRRSGEIVVVGQTESADFPTTVGAVSGSYRGNADAFVGVIGTGGALIASTFLSGSGGEFEPSIAPQLEAGITVVGATFSADFPTTPAGLAPASAGGIDGYVARLDATLTSLVFSTYLGGSLGDFPTAAAVDVAGRTVVVGDTASGDFPLSAGCYDPAMAGGDFSFPTDAFVVRLSATGSELQYSSYIGGGLGDGARDVAWTKAGGALVVGLTQSADFPVTPLAFQQAHGGGEQPYIGFDGVAFKLDLLPVGVTLVESATGCGSGSQIGVNHQPLAGDATFAITCVGAPTLVLGVLILAPGAAGSALPLGTSPMLIPVTGNADGTLEQSVTLGGVAKGQLFHASFALGGGACGFAVGMTDTIEISVQ